MIAGPNGAGKSTLVQTLRDIGTAFPNLHNADEITRDLLARGESASLANRMAQAQVIEARDEALARGLSFSYETVMSHESHLRAMEIARENGHFVRLIFIGTERPELNVLRVQDRVAKGGHDVPAERIRSRYIRTMGHSLPRAVRLADEAMVFDNSAAGDRAGPRRVAHVMGLHARRFATPGLSWPDRYLWPSLLPEDGWIVVDHTAD